MRRHFGLLVIGLLTLSLALAGWQCSKEEGRGATDKPPKAQEATGARQKMEGQTEVVEKWTCPMHPEVISDEPGQCPECNMDLVPMHEGQTHQPMEMDEKRGEEVKEWTCGMHPAIRSEEPGKCPICNMDLVPVETSETGALMIAPDKLAGVRVEREELSYLQLVREIATSGRIDYDERRVRYVASRVSGRVERLFADFVGINVREGEPLLEIYSPDLIATLEELKRALEASELGIGRTSHMTALAEAARSRLLLWGLSESDITEALESGGAYELTIRSPIAGTVIGKSAVEGKYVREGEKLYVVADLSVVWLIADVFEEDVGKIQIGDEVIATTRAFPNQTFHGNVAFIDPYVDERTRSVRVRLEIHNPDLKLKPGMFVEARIKVPVNRYAVTFWTCPMPPGVKDAKPGECPECGMFLEEVPGGGVLAVPSKAVVFWGDVPVVYVERKPGEFVPRQVEIDPVAVDGQTRGDYYPVLAGLMPGERVVTEGSFLINSQARLTGTAASAYGGALKVEPSQEPR
ncbi:MAG TPA: efflux RND transporter periplasmic adaptor subunit [Firmicutes bacterium]|nr:efflux RND transporter periplasmic adaptor subunit [Bacillota bacterium]